MTSASGGLAGQIAGLAVPHGAVAIWALGQSGFVLKGGETIAYIDPYLSDSIADGGGPARRFPAPIAPQDVTHATIVLATHEHRDHTDAPTLLPLLAASPQASLIASVQAKHALAGTGLDPARILTPKLGERTALGGLACTPIPAAHYGYEVDDAGHSRYMGFLIEINGITIYHSGDTLVFPELLAALEGRRVDIAMLPINGRDYFREQQQITGNTNPAEAIELALAIEAKVLLGCHNDLFATNRVPPGTLWDELDRRAPFQRCHILQPGELYVYMG